MAAPGHADAPGAGAAGGVGFAAIALLGAVLRPGIDLVLDLVVVAVCGHRSLDSQTLHGAGIIAAYALTDLEPDVQRCIDHPRPPLKRIGERIAEEHLNTQA
jgi:glycerate 2-kinase